MSTVLPPKTPNADESDDQEKEPTPLQRLKEVAKRRPKQENEIALFKMLKAENAHYPIAIIATAMIELALQEAILQRFVHQETPEAMSEIVNQLFSYQQHGPLADFGARIFIARLLGIFVPITYADLKVIHRIKIPLRTRRVHVDLPIQKLATHSVF